MPSWKNEQVLIVGGGIGGLTAALALARQGIASQVIEQAGEFKEIGAGIQLGPNVFWMFERLGLIEPVSALAVFPENLVMLDSITGEEVTRIPLGDAFRKKFHHPYALIHRGDLHRVLLDACRKSNLIRLDAAQKIVAVDEVNGGIKAKTASGKDYRGAALIGADGLWSTIREIVVGDGKPKPAGHITYRAVLPMPEIPEQYRWHNMTLWAGEKVHFVLYPLRTGELYNLVAVFHSNRYEEGWDSYGDPAELHERFAATCAPVRALLNKIESWRMWVLCDRPPIKEWSRGRITLLGDAAHPMLQYLAQGAAMAVEDAVCLADKAVAADGDYAAAFRAYQQARYLRTGRVQIMARVYGEFYHAGGVAKELRNMMLGARTPEEAMAGMEWIYGEQKELTRGGAGMARESLGVTR
ncbi:salicylate hydroxylase [Rhodoplanes sp. JGI PP 4-B12]|uniref:3-hydroxybenzoate 6-monooxygenase n=1 Tax=Rhodoplanes sp. JGI PP 4-B12 TaxID=1873883 RepID=UPI000B4FD49C|nr:3-hydroxybenzoate 6-monooxygenase [Rhodoplanes sp. JGI PP 4-B12]SNB54772.1 salicylate hydroxylase [Rhodoplanes sp. JGI PP 4-B12]SNB55024.1 salicylate hydroxylase [Rhodoplanes sp. JGI PP 4-B12]